jgi:hypothetical protein
MPGAGLPATDGNTTGTEANTTATELTQGPPEAPDPKPNDGTADVSVCHRCQETLIKIPIARARYNALCHSLAQPLDLLLRPPSRRRG